ncbi:hypothetical protein ACOME3_009346 [Neoechinorhynchus agilis]
MRIDAIERLISGIMDNGEDNEINQMTIESIMSQIATTKISNSSISSVEPNELLASKKMAIDILSVLKRATVSSLKSLFRNTESNPSDQQLLKSIISEIGKIIQPQIQMNPYFLHRISASITSHLLLPWPIKLMGNHVNDQHAQQLVRAFYLCFQFFFYRSIKCIISECSIEGNENINQDFYNRMSTIFEDFYQELVCLCSRTLKCPSEFFREMFDDPAEVTVQEMRQHNRDFITFIAGFLLRVYRDYPTDQWNHSADVNQRVDRYFYRNTINYDVEDMQFSDPVTNINAVLITNMEHSVNVQDLNFSDQYKQLMSSVFRFKTDKSDC